MPSTLDQILNDLAHLLREREWKLVTAESCTGGGVAYAITNLAGSSAWFERGFVTYSNLAKEESLGVSSQTLNEWGAVSAETAREMAVGALENSQAQVSVAITGIAGPDGGTTSKPVGTVWFAWAAIDRETISEKYQLIGDRQAIREQSIQIALEKLFTYLQKK